MNYFSSLGPFDSRVSLLLVVFLAKVLMELAGRYSENCYLTHRHGLSALFSGAVVVIGVPVSRLAIVDADPWAISAMTVAVVATTWIGSRDLERQQVGDSK